MILIVDTETTGFDPKKDEMIEMACAIFDEEESALVRCDSFLLKGTQKDQAFSVNGIPQSLLDRYGYRRDYMKRDYSGLSIEGARCVVAHNASFDRQWLTRTEALGLEWVCSLKDIRWPRGTGKLETLALNHGVAVLPGHRAIYDVLTLVRVFEAMPQFGTTAKALIDEALIPRKTYRSCQTFSKNSEAQELGFSWNGKAWMQRLTEDELRAVVSKATFAIVEVSK